ncbi:MAG: hypothetical protein H8D05_00375 [FCB group bacterium]|nr:hypothetical protein [FCB group bacterium]
MRYLPNYYRKLHRTCQYADEAVIIDVEELPHLHGLSEEAVNIILGEPDFRQELIL